MTTIVLLISACGSQENAKQSSEPESKYVELAAVTSLNIENRTDLASLLEPGEETLAAFEVGGRVLELLGEEGDTVEPGNRLARLDATEYGVQESQSQLGLDNAQITCQQAMDTYKRIEELYKAGAVSLSDYEKARDGLAMAENARDSAQRSYDLLSGKEWLTAPIGGIVLSKMVSKGQLVAAGTPAYRIGDINELKVILPVPDYEIRQWKIDDRVNLTLYGETREAKVSKVHPATNKDTGTIGVELRLPNPKHDWHPGQLVQVSRKLNGQKATFVPVQSVINRGEKQPYVYVANDGKAMKRAVAIGRISGSYLEITSGLKAGEKVVSRGADRLFDGDLIKTGGNSE